MRNYEDVKENGREQRKQDLGIKLKVPVGYIEFRKDFKKMLSNSQWM